MFAPFASSRAVCLTVLCLVVTLLAGGCTLPGRGRLAPAPKDLPASMRYVPSDAPAFLVVNTDTTSPAWRKLRGGAQFFLPKDLPAAATNALVTFRELAPKTWVGHAAGVVLLSTDLSDEGAYYGYADVAKRSALESALRTQHYERDGSRDGFDRWKATGVEVAVSDRTVLFMRSPKALDTILARAAQGRVSADLDLRKDAVESLRNAPVGVVFREDALSNQLRRLVQDDPAKLELSRWFDASSLIASVLDGWIGINGHEAAQGGLQLTGRLHWVPESLRVRRPQPVSRAILDRQSPYVRGDVAFDDLGIIAHDLVDSATANGSEFATKHDVSDAKDRVDLFSTLDELNGDSSVVWGGDGPDFTTRVDHPEAVAKDVRAALKHAGLTKAEVMTSARGLLIAPRGSQTRLVVASVDRPTRLADRDDYIGARNATATAPKRVLSWFSFLHDLDARTGTTCVGWLGEAGHDRLALSVGITRPTTAGALDGGCTAPLARLL